MTPRARKPWSEIIEESGTSVRLYERAPGSLRYREVRLEGAKDRKSLGHRDRQLAAPQALELARRRADYLLEHLGDRLVLTDISQSHVDGYAAARRGGAIGDKRRPENVRGVRDGTARSELLSLSALRNFVCGFRVGGRTLLGANPLRGLTLAKANAADPTGGLACLLALARYTGRRITAICEFPASDVRLSADTVARVLAATGQDPAVGKHMPHGAIRWRAESDKQGYEDVSPISALARAALERYLRAHPRVGDVWMFPQPKHPDRPTNESLARIFDSAPSRWRSFRRLSGVDSTVTGVRTRPIESIFPTSTSRARQAGGISRRLSDRISSRTRR